MSHVPDIFWGGMQDALSRELDRCVPHGASVAYLDYPVHSNVGDDMIYLGTELWFRKAGLNVVGRWPAFGFRFPQLPEAVALVCHGGGNFGDLYMHQQFREDVINAYPKHRIVFLPQTLRYEDTDRLAQAAETLGRAADLHLLFRDAESLQIAGTHFPHADCCLAPDMAVFLFPVSETVGATAAGASTRRLVYHLRSGVERKEEEAYLRPEDGAWVGDWKKIGGGLYYAARAWQALGFALGKVGVPQGYARVWAALSGCLLRRAVSFYRTADHVVTSRLHGHILACILGVPNTVLDNRSGKNFSYFRQWHSELPYARMGRVDEGEVVPCQNGEPEG